MLYFHCVEEDKRNVIRVDTYIKGNSRTKNKYEGMSVGELSRILILIEYDIDLS